MAWVRPGDGIFFTAYKRESVELFEVGNDMVELTAIRRDPVAGDLYDLTFNNVSRGGVYFPSDDAAIEWSEGVLADPATLKTMFGYVKE